MLSAMVNRKRGDSAHRELVEAPDGEEEIEPPVARGLSARRMSPMLASLSPWESGTVPSPRVVTPSQPNHTSQAAEVKAMLDAALQREQYKAPVGEREGNTADGWPKQTSPDVAEGARPRRSVKATQRPPADAARSPASQPAPTSPLNEVATPFVQAFGAAGATPWDDMSQPFQPVASPAVVLDWGARPADSWPPVDKISPSKSTTATSSKSEVCSPEPSKAEKVLVDDRDAAQCFDEAILAALAALPSQVLVDVLRRLSKQRPEEVQSAFKGTEPAHDAQGATTEPTAPAITEAPVPVEDAAATRAPDPAAADEALDAASRLENGADKLQRAFEPLFDEPKDGFDATPPWPDASTSAPTASPSWPASAPAGGVTPEVADAGWPPMPTSSAVWPPPASAVAWPSDPIPLAMGAASTAKDTTSSDHPREAT